MIYKTKQGDQWDVISYRMYGTERFVDKLMHANPEYLDVGIFAAGVSLFVPEVEVTEIGDSLPPWMR